MLEHNKQFCTFRLGDLFLGIDVIQVQEILRPQEMTHVPHAPSEVRGLINLRGQIVTAIDLRELLHVPPCEETSKEEQMNITLFGNARRLGSRCRPRLSRKVTNFCTKRKRKNFHVFS